MSEREFICDCPCACGVGVRGEGEMCAACAAGDHYEPEDADDGPERACLICGGEGVLAGEDMGDPLWYDRDGTYPCYSCRGSGRREDMTVW